MRNSRQTGHNHAKRYSTGEVHSRREGLRVERRWLLGVDRREGGMGRREGVRDGWTGGSEGRTDGREGGKGGKGCSEEWTEWGLKRQMRSEI